MILNKKIEGVLIRFFDILFSFLGLLCLVPIALCVGIALYFFQDKQVFFSQLRPGLKGHCFKLFKFKTMYDLYDETGQILSDHERLSRVGSIVRSMSLDELPQLYNVLKGDMSLVGPRPLLPEYLPLYSTEQMKRHDVKPGITGWAQINGRNAVDWQQRFEYDIWFVKNYSIKLYFKILFLTVFKVFQREGISAVGEVTMPKFKGNS